MVKDGVFKINQNKIPVTVRGVLPSEPKRPEWMKVKANLGSDYVSLKNLLSEKKLNTVCEEASCPNIYEGWSMGTATFMSNGIETTRNYAGINFTYDESRDAFIEPKPYASWILNETTY